MTYEQIEKEFDDEFVFKNKRQDGVVAYEEWLSEYSCEEVKSFLKQSFIKYLQSEVERLEKTLIRNEEFGFCKHCSFHKGDMEHDFGKCAGHDEAISDQITHLKAQIKELEV